MLLHTIPINTDRRYSDAAKADISDAAKFVRLGTNRAATTPCRHNWRGVGDRHALLTRAGPLSLVANTNGPSHATHSH